MSLNRFQKHVQTIIDGSLEGIVDSLSEHAPELKQAMRYALLSGGKRMRPLLVFATGEMLDVPEHDLTVIAGAIECVHAYSLVHDDLPAMDNDAMRRGKPTCHIAFNEATAILAGDALQTMAFELLASQPLSGSSEPQRIALIRQLARASGYAGMCGGQAMDLSATNQQISLEQLTDLHRKKTGALLEAAVQMPALCGVTTNEQIILSLADYSRALGLAFQVQDDILDVVGDSDVLGKPQGSDQALNKSTFPAILGLEGAQAYLNKLHQQALQALHGLPYNTEILRSLAEYVANRDH
ncbi:(2E,6E)-farnesyl diphosphate synthase [Aestuariibacter salexigens]|uniref:(2E,6E)-farnesyl diphosphate synthase n=1 Tax=Aestuariibacter salexigens TaxID=226010 RepID=UPI000478E594|nr:farnesyl diphosphate synthase [Aestuariibacter salexigens]